MTISDIDWKYVRACLCESLPQSPHKWVIFFTPN